MEDEWINSQKTNEIKPSADTLPVLNIHTNQVEIAKGADKNGNLQKVPPGKKRKMTSSSELISTAIYSPTSFPTSTGSLKTLHILIFSKFPNIMPLVPLMIFKSM